VETTNEVHLFPYGYFQHAKFIRQSGKDVVQIQFQDRIVSVKGKGLEPLCDALERLAVERISPSSSHWGGKQLFQEAGMCKSLVLLLSAGSKASVVEKSML
jgi:hypothetical protein